MADNVVITSGTGVSIATDQDGGGSQHQWVKIEIGGDGSFVPVTTANGLPVQILSLPAFAAGSSVTITSLPDLGLNSSVKITSLPDLGLNSSIKITSLPALAAGTSLSVSGLTSAIVSISNLPLIVSLPALAIMSISGLASASVSVSNIANVKIESLPALGVGSTVSVSGLTSAIVSISNLPLIVSLPALAIMSISGLASASVSVSNIANVKIESLPALGAGSITSISGLTSAIVSISNLPLIVSLPALAIMSISGLTSASVSVSNIANVKIESLPALGAGSITSISGLTSAIVSLSPGTVVIESLTSYRVNLTTTSPISGRWNVTATYTAAQTNALLINLSGSTTAHHITDIFFSNGQTHGSFTLICSRSNAAIYPVLDRLYCTDYGGAVINLTTPIVLDTNSAIAFTSRSATDHSVMIVGYTR